MGRGHPGWLAQPVKLRLVSWMIGVRLPRKGIFALRGRFRAAFDADN